MENRPQRTARIDGYELENIIREKAYQLWEAAGRPPNASMEFWQQARDLVWAEYPDNALADASLEDGK